MTLNDTHRCWEEGSWDDWIRGIEDLCFSIHEWAKEKGFWDEPRSEAECMALEHSEISERLEALRHGNPPDEHCPDFTSEEIEAADLVIRLCDYCGKKKLRLAEAILAKMSYNETRPYKHGKEF